MAFLQLSFVGSALSWTTAGHVFYYSTFSVPVDTLIKVYLKVLFLHLYSSSFTLTTWLLRLMMMRLLPSLLMFLFLTMAQKKEDAEAAAQSVVSSVVTWIWEWKLNLNADKSKVCPFSTWSNDSNWNPSIFIDTQKVRVNTTSRLLGVILDRSLTFSAHLKKLTASLTSSIRIIRAMTHTSWGWHRSTLKMAFHALIRSKLDYTAPA